MEHNVLTETFADIEKYLRKKDSEVDKEVNDMGDENYVTWSESIRAECAKENEQKLAEKEQKLAEKDKQLAEKDDKLAEQYEKIAEQGEKLAEKDEIILELKRQLAALKS
jgi:alpha-D-ribose 1-methylphosphonate 5-triphosphate diphosphatase PhnM